MKVAEMAAEAGQPCVPHSADHSLVTVFTMTFLRAIENSGEYFEYSLEDHWAEGMFTSELPVQDGEIAIPSGPGWGVEFNNEWLATSNHESAQL